MKNVTYLHVFEGLTGDLHIVEKSGLLLLLITQTLVQLLDVLLETANLLDVVDISSVRQTTTTRRRMGWWRRRWRKRRQLTRSACLIRMMMLIRGRRRRWRRERRWYDAVCTTAHRFAHRFETLEEVAKSFSFFRRRRRRRGWWGWLWRVAVDDTLYLFEQLVQPFILVLEIAHLSYHALFVCVSVVVACWRCWTRRWGWCRVCRCWWCRFVFLLLLVIVCFK